MSFLESHTHVAIFLVVLLDTVGLPIPGEVFLLAAGFLVSAGKALSSIGRRNTLTKDFRWFEPS